LAKIEKRKEAKAKNSKNLNRFKAFGAKFWLVI